MFMLSVKCEYMFRKWTHQCEWVVAKAILADI